MTVIAIIGILAGLILGIAGYASRKADRSRAIAELEKIKYAMDEYRVIKGGYPGFASETALTNNSLFAELTNSLPRGFDTSEIARVDPWGNGYLYQRVGTMSFKLRSLGPDSLDAGDDLSSESGGM